MPFPKTLDVAHSAVPLRLRSLAPEDLERRCSTTMLEYLVEPFHLLHPQFGYLSLQDQVPLHQVLQHLQSPLQPDTGAQAAVKLEGKRDRERCDNYHDRDVDCGEGELWKSCELIG